MFSFGTEGGESACAEYHVRGSDRDGYGGGGRSTDGLDDEDDERWCGGELDIGEADEGKEGGKMKRRREGERSSDHLIDCFRRG